MQVCLNVIDRNFIFSWQEVLVATLIYFETESLGGWRNIEQINRYAVVNFAWLFIRIKQKSILILASFWLYHTVLPLD